MDNLRRVIAYARDYKDAFVQQVSDNTMAEQTKQLTIFKRQLRQQTRRIAEIDAIIQHLYADNLNGKLTDERFTKMSITYEQEQQKLESSAAELRNTIDSCEQQKVNVKSFLRLVKSYIEPDELTPEILHMFVEKIIVHNAERPDGHRIQQIDIHYNFVGQLDMSVELARTRRRTKEEVYGQTAPYLYGA